ncbi:hypothetical protein [Cohnella caldifontis]|uniref:hypothetical protein n=1 Tax=Cohnella caldifontis TaxID=3027471 RepID=UPI0023EABA3A|nr:hypothetical protein [Cohnella sp. YIM B05605]
MSGFTRGRGALLTALTAVILLAGCGQRSEPADPQAPTASAVPTESSAPSATESGNPSPSPSPDQPTIADQFVARASGDVRADDLLQALADSLKRTDSPEQADAMLRAMESYAVRKLPDAENRLQADQVQQQLSELTFPVTKEQIEDLKDDSLREDLLEIVSGGFKLDTTEGYVYPVVDYAALSALASGASAGMKDYLSLMAAETERKTASDGGLVIPREELLARALNAENFVKQYPDAPERDAVAQKFTNYLFIYLVGLNNTPVFDYETYHVLPEVRTEWEKTVADHPGTVTAKMTQRLLEILDKTKGALFEKGKDGMQADIAEVKAFRDGLQIAAKAALSE